MSAVYPINNELLNKYNPIHLPLIVILSKFKDVF